MSARAPRPRRRVGTAALGRGALAVIVATGITVPAVAFADDAPNDPVDEPLATPDEDVEPEPEPEADPGQDPTPADPTDEPDPDTTTTTTTTVPATEPTPDDGADPDATSPTTTVPATTTPVTAPPFVPTTSGIDLSQQPAELQHILATIRYLESRNTYDIGPNRSKASGAYQFIPSTWAGFGGYAHAYQAPPAVQDERALLDVKRFLDRFDGDISMVPLMWYYPRVVREPELMDTIPVPQNNVLTIREYQTRWLSIYADISGIQLRPVSSGIYDPTRAGLPPEVPERSTVRLAAEDDADERRVEVPLSYPVLGPSRMASLDCATEVDVDDTGLCAEQAPGVVFGVKLQPVLAAADGIVTAIEDDPGSDEPISVVVTSPDGISIEYRGFNDDRPGTDDGQAPDHLRLSPLAKIGGIVRAGQVIGFMGDSDPLPPSIRADVPTDSTERLDPDAAAPHIRLTITDRTGRPIDAVGPLLDARARESCRVGIGGWSMPPVDGLVDEVTIETTDLHDDIDSEWIITATGQVLASGWAAMINPVELCDWVPGEHHGPGGAGAVDWLEHWIEPYDLPTELWVDLALRDEATPDSFVLPG